MTTVSSAQHVLQTVFGYDQFRHQQQAIIDAVIAGENVVNIMPTGGGKSLCYQIPALVRNGVGVVVSPLIALMKDQVDALRELGVNAAYLNSTQDRYQQMEVEEMVRAGEIQLLYVAPERLLMERTLALLEQSDVALFAIDEAHCVSQWGHDFRPEYQQLSILQQRFPQVPRIALTATADSRTQQEIIEQLDLVNAKHFVHSFDRPNIRYHVSEPSNAKRDLWSFISEMHPNDAGVVYCLSRKKVDETAEWLRQQGRTALAYHAGMPAASRDANQQRFLREDGVIIVATIAFGMGIDKPDVRFVAHLSLPKSVESYYQETGRAGRDGEPANAWMAYSMQDMVLQRQMQQNSEGSEQYKQIQSQKLNALLGYCELSSCRRQTLLRYFGEESEPCGNCDNCISPPSTWDGTVAAQKALSTVYRCDQRFGVTYLINVLLGKSDDRIQRFGHDKVSTFGIGQELNANQWKGVFRQLIAMNYLDVVGEYNSLKLTAKCREVLRGDQQVELRELRKAKTKAKAKSAKTSSNDPLSAADLAQFETLKQVRSELAKAQDVPAYIICHDSTLREIALKRPTTLEALAHISGLGETKIARYGEQLIEQVQPASEPSKVLSDTEKQSVELYKQLFNIEQVALERSLSAQTIHSHLCSGIELGLLSLSEVIDIAPQQLDLIEQAAIQTNAIAENRLKPLYDALEEQVSYDVLKCALAHFKHQHLHAQN